MPYKIKTPPTLEVLTVNEIKSFIGIISTSIAEEITPVSTIAPGSHAIGNITGSSVDVSAYNSIIQVDSRTNQATGTVDLTIMESNDNSTFTAWTGGTFAQITTANDNQFYQLEYTGGMKYIRIDATVASAACEFGVNILLKSPASDDDTLISDYLKTARQVAEEYQNKCYLPQAWYLILDKWPREDYIKIKKCPVRSITSIKYTDSDNNEHTLDTDLYYLDDRGIKEFPRIALEYGEVWPSVTLKPSGAIVIEFESGFTNLAAYKATMNSATDMWIKTICKRMYNEPDFELNPKKASMRALDIDAIRNQIA